MFCKITVLKASAAFPGEQLSLSPFLQDVSDDAVLRLKKDSVTSVFLEILPIFLERLFFGTVLVDCICFLQFLDYMMSKATPV